MPLPHDVALSEEIGVLEPHRTTMFSGKSVNGDAPFKLTAFGVKDETCPRCLIFTLWPHHGFWKLETAEEVYTYLEKAFPCITNFRGWLSPEEAVRIVTDTPGQFPDPQACKSLVAEFPESRLVEATPGTPTAQLKGSAVLLVGDASHSMPPGAVVTTSARAPRQQSASSCGDHGLAPVPVHAGAQQASDLLRSC